VRDVRRCIARPKKPPRISFPRFAQKSGFGERRSDAKSLRVKIFPLPKSATQSPREALSVAIDESRHCAQHVIRIMSE